MTIKEGFYLSFFVACFIIDQVNICLSERNGFCYYVYF